MITFRAELSEKMNVLVAVLDCLLARYANDWQVVDYATIAEEAGGYAPRNKYLADALGILAREDRANGRPMRSALVLRIDTSLPGKGFFDLISELEGHQYTEEEKPLRWYEEFRKLLDYVTQKGY